MENIYKIENDEYNKYLVSKCFAVIGFVFFTACILVILFEYNMWLQVLVIGQVTFIAIYMRFYYYHHLRTNDGKLKERAYLKNVEPCV